MALDEGGGAAPQKKKRRPAPVQGEQASGGSKVPVARPPRPVRAVRPVSAPSLRRSPGDQPGSSTRPVRPRTLAAFPGIEVSEGINWRGVNPRLVRALSGLAQATGQTIYVTSGFRSYEKQTQLYEQLAGTGTPVAAPGTSNHEEGQAIDAVVNGQAIGEFFDEATLAEHGLFSLASINDPVHVELRRPGSYNPPAGSGGGGGGGGGGGEVSSPSPVAASPAPVRTRTPRAQIVDNSEPPTFWEGGFGSQLEPLIGTTAREAINESLINNFRPVGFYGDPSVPDGVVFPVQAPGEAANVQGGKFLEKRKNRLQEAKAFAIDTRALEMMRSIWDIVAPQFFPGQMMPVPVFLFRKDAEYDHAAWVMPGKQGYRLVHWPRDNSRRLVRGEGFPVQLLLHEWAHVFQNNFRSKAKIEGGAESFASTVYPQVAERLGVDKVPFGPPENYRRFVEQVSKRDGRDYVLWEQFGGVRPHDRPSVAEMWGQLASLPGASPETQALARLAQTAAPATPGRIPNPYSLRELERKSLLP